MDKRISKNLIPVVFPMLCGLSLVAYSCMNTPDAHAMSERTTEAAPRDTLPSWMLGPFIKLDSINPCLRPSMSQVFICPISNQTVHWEEKDVFNPAVIVRDGVLEMLYRAEDKIGRNAGTSRLGLAQSQNGLYFEKLPEPVFFPDRDEMFQYEWEGGCEDPRIVRRPDGLYVMTYTSYDGETARLCVASSRDLRAWTKQGLAFADQEKGRFVDLWSKSGAIVSVYDTTGSITATKLKGKYWMYCGDRNIHLATSDDLLRWTLITDSTGMPVPVLSPRARMFDSYLVEPGPPAVLRDDGILLIYNSKNWGAHRDTTIAEGVYSAGQVLFDLDDPSRILLRSDNAFLAPDREYEISGQVNQVVFLEGLVRWKKQWLLYYGTADSRIGVAVAE